MRNGSDELREVLKGSFDHHYVADLYYNGDRRQQNVPITGVSFQENAVGNVQHSGSVTVVWSDEFASSILPREVADAFTPFGAQLRVFSVVEAGRFQERVEYGWFEITDVPSARDEQLRFRSEWLTVGSVVELELKDLFAGLSEETFDVPTAPESLVSTWDELGRVSGLPLRRTVADVSITRSIMYPENKLDAVYDLSSVMLDATPHMTADGCLAARPNTWPGVMDIIREDVLLDVGSRMTAEGIVNRVVVRAVSGDQKSVLAVAEITSGPLRVRNDDGSVSPFRARTRYLASEFVTTAAQAQAWADSELAARSTLKTRTVPIVETFNPLRERGDVILIEQPSEWLVGRVVTVRRGEGGTQSLTAEVAYTLPPDIETPPLSGDLPSPFPASDQFPASDFFPGSS